MVERISDKVKTDTADRYRAFFNEHSPDAGLVEGWYYYGHEGLVGPFDSRAAAEQDILKAMGEPPVELDTRGKAEKKD